jgi:L-asparaginase II
MPPPSSSPHLACSEPILVTAVRYEISDRRIVPQGSRSPENPVTAGLVENRHIGWAIVSDSRQTILYSTPGAQAIATFFRSAAKPFQAFPLLETGYLESLSSEDLAIACASHSASQEHVDQVEHLLDKAGLDASALQCGPDEPGDGVMRRALRASGFSPGKIHNNCSGKHAGMLLCCRAHGWDASRYLQPDHPLQQRILRVLRHWGGVAEIPLAVDGCGAPVFYLPLATMARLYACLGAEDAFSPLREAMLAHPELVGGEGRVDTAIMQASRGHLLAKVGADGVLCASHPGTGQGLALKIADGSASVRNLALVHLLRALGWLDDAAWDDPRLAPHREHRRFNTLGQAVGEYQVHYLPKSPL